MIGQAEDMEHAMECFAQEAAEKVAQFWTERSGAPLSADQQSGLVDGIWESLVSGSLDGTGVEARGLVHAT